MLTTAINKVDGVIKSTNVHQLHTAKPCATQPASAGPAPKSKILDFAEQTLAEVDVLLHPGNQARLMALLEKAEATFKNVEAILPADLKQAIAETMQEKFGKPVTPEEEVTAAPASETVAVVDAAAPEGALKPQLPE